MKRRLLTFILIGALMSVSMPEKFVEVGLTDTVCTSEAAAKYSKAKAKKKLIKYLKKRKEYKKKNHIFYDSTQGNRYVFWYCESTPYRMNTINYYYVNKKTGKIKPMF